MILKQRERALGFTHWLSAMTETPDEIARDWYNPESVFAAIANGGHGEIPKDRFAKEFAEWLCNEYRLAMAKGIQLAREEQSLILEELTEELRRYWSFDNYQQHTHSWHDREDFISKTLPKLLSR